MNARTKQGTTRAEDADGSSLDPRARGALRRLVRVIHRCGSSPGAIAQAMEEEIRTLSKTASEPRSRVEPEMPLAPEVLTAWSRDPPYVDARGEPLPLKRHGPAPSFETLVRRVDSKLNADAVLKYLIRAGSVRHHRGHYWAVNRVVILRDFAGPRDFRLLRGVDAMLLNAEHNLMPAKQGPGWLERTVENTQVPARALPAFAVFLERKSMGLLGDLDAWLHHAAGGARPGERTVQVTVGVYHSQEECISQKPTPSGRGKQPPRQRSAKAGR